MPNISLPDLPNFKGGTTSLDQDLRAQRNSAFSGMNDQIIQLANLIQDLQDQYGQQVQGLGKERDQSFLNLASDYAARGVIGSSGYGQDYISNVEDFTKQRNELDQWLGRGQRDVLQSRSSAVQQYQNLLNELVGIQGQRDADKRVQDILGQATGGGSSKSGGKSGGSGGKGTKTIKMTASSAGKTPQQVMADLERIRKNALANPMGWN
jgi:hypothetical protein